MDEALQCAQEPQNAREMVLVFHQNGLSTVSARLIAPGSRLVGFGPGCCVPLLGVGLSRRYLLNLSMGAWTRTPPRSSGALARFFPDDIGLTSV
jgi:hypothetical protein